MRRRLFGERRPGPYRRRAGRPRFSVRTSFAPEPRIDVRGPEAGSTDGRGETGRSVEGGGQEAGSVEGESASSAERDTGQGMATADLSVQGGTAGPGRQEGVNSVPAFRTGNRWDHPGRAFVMAGPGWRLLGRGVRFLSGLGRRRLFGLLVVLAGGALAAYAYVSVVSPVPGGPVRFLFPGGPEEERPAEGRDVEEDRSVLVEMQVRQTTRYRQCGHEETVVRVFRTPMPTLDRETLSALFPEWSVVSLDAEGAELFREEDGLCPEDATYRHLRVKDGYVAVYYGKPRPDAPLKEVTDVPAAWLLPEDIRRLETGLVLEGDAEVRKYLEGLRE